VFVERLVCGSAAAESQLWRIVLFGVIPAIVVVDFVVVPRHQPRARRVSGGQRRVTLIECVSSPVVVERVALGGIVAAYQLIAPAQLIHVVANMHDEVR
jgi:hypothetical protein